MFLDEPHLASRYYGNLLNSVKDKIFCQDHRPTAYYISAYTNHKLDSLIRKKQIDEKYRPFKYIMLMALRIKLGGKKMPSMESKNFERYCQSIQKNLWDNTKIIESFGEVCDLLDQILAGDYDRAHAKTMRLVSAVRDAI